MELRGFDTYTISLGDEMRGERACLGKSLRDAQRDLCIRAELLEAIENACIEKFPNRSVVPGYVRSYARYLGMDPEAVYSRFCEESGFQSSLVTFGMTAEHGDPGGRGGQATVSGAVGADFAASRFAVKPAPRRIGAPVSLGGIVSGLALAGLVVGLGYGGWAVLQDIQRVGFTPLPDAPAVVADAPTISSPAFADPAFADALPAGRPDASAYSGDGVLAGLVPPATLAPPASLRRDGPISAINPESAGIFAYERAPALAAITDAGDAFGGGSHPAEAGVAQIASLVAAPGAVEAAAEPPAPPDNSVEIIATDRAWVRIRDAAGATLFEGILSTGESFVVPERADAPVMRAGNAGGVVFRVGALRYGPLGQPGQVVKQVSLVADDIRAAYAAIDGGDAAGTELQSAEAAVAD